MNDISIQSIRTKKLIVVLILALLVAISFSGCTITGGISYTDPESGATANFAFGSSGKTIKLPRNYAK